MNDYDVIVIGRGAPGVGERMEKEHGESEAFKLERHVSAIGRCPRVVRNDRYGTKRNGHLSTRPGYPARQR